MRSRGRPRGSHAERDPVEEVSADAASWASEVDRYGRNRPVQRAWIVVPAYLAAVPVLDQDRMAW